MFNIGLTVLLAPAGIGKTTSLLSLSENTGINFMTYEEPMDDRIVEKEVIPDLNTLLEMPKENSFIVDSLRSLFFMSEGATLKGGFSAGALSVLTRIHNNAFLNNQFVIAAVNPLYTTDVATLTEFRIVQELISGSVGRLIVPDASVKGANESDHDPYSFFLPSETKIERDFWITYRTRAREDDDLVSRLNVIYLQNS